ncbi:ParB/RepB/Spo0J family partition protein [Candidatus Saccharibacteria bacterium]|nr:ParB/RepB/Spo0J family partition protein [Candidatus Saccharibacteria bacterium]
MIKRGLGKGFDALIPTDVLDEDFDTTAAEDEKVSDLRVLAIDDIVPDTNQPRQHFDEEAMAALAESIREHGVLQPIVVAPAKKGFQIVAGERRWRAAKDAGLRKIPAIVRTLGAQHRLELSIIENVQRADLNPLETATAFLKLKTQFNLTDAEIAARVGKGLSTVSNHMRLLGLPDFAKEALIDGQLSEGHARQILALASVGGDATTQRKLFDLMIKESWSVRKAEQFVVGFKRGKAGSQLVREQSAHRATLAETEFTREIAKKIGLKKASVRQKITAHGGEIVIKFSNEKELAKIQAIFGTPTSVIPN